MQTRQNKKRRNPSRGVLAHVIPLDQLRAVDRLALLDLVPRLVADGRERGVRRQGLALSVLPQSQPSSSRSFPPQKTLTDTR